MKLCQYVQLLGFVVALGISAEQRLSALDVPEAAKEVQSNNAQVDLRPELKKFGLLPRRQGARPTCSVFTITSALEFAEARHEGASPRLSVEFLNWSANKACGHRQDGGFFSDLWKGYTAYGICPETDMPYEPTIDLDRGPSVEAISRAKQQLAHSLRLHWIKEWNVKTGLNDEEFLEIKKTLRSGWPVCGGFRWPKQEHWVDGVLQMCPADGVFDGHSVLLVGYSDQAAQPGGGIFYFRNTSNGGKDGEMPYAYARAYMNDSAWIDCP